MCSDIDTLQPLIRFKEIRLLLFQSMGVKPRHLVAVKEIKATLTARLFEGRRDDVMTNPSKRGEGDKRSAHQVGLQAHGDRWLCPQRLKRLDATRGSGRSRESGE